MRYRIGVVRDQLGRPKWLPLVVRYLSKQIYKSRHISGESSRNVYIWSLAQRLCELRRGLEEGNDNLGNEMLRCLETVVEVDLFKADWILRSHLLDSVDDGVWNPDAETSDLLDIAVWLDDMKLIRQLLALEDTEVHDDATKAERLSSRLLMAAEHGNFETTRFLNSHARGVDAGISSEAVRSLLIRGYLTRNPALFHFALDQYDEDDPVSCSDLGLIAFYCTSAYAYRRIVDIIRKQDPVLTHRPFIYGDRRGHYRLVYAAKYGYLDLVEYFVNGVVPWDDPDRQQGVASDVEVEERRRLLSMGLIGAVHGGYLLVVKFLLDKGADPNIYPCLNASIRQGYVEITRLLVDHGADVMLGFPPPVAIAVTQEDMVSFRYLLDKGALSDDRGCSGGAWAMGVAKALGLDSMVSKLVQAGVPDDARMHWVPTIEEEKKFPVQRRDYERSLNLCGLP